MKKILGISGLLIVICVATGIANPKFFSAYNIQNTVNWSSLFALISIGAAFVIITGGIDLSIGSVVGLSGCLLPIFLHKGVPVPVALLLVALLAAGIGLIHGLLITGVGLQPFVVTLCGLLIYRGLSRWLTGEDTQRFDGFDSLTDFFTSSAKIGSASVPYSFFILIIVAVIAAIFLNKTIWGRYMFAVGRNEEAARYSGISTAKIKIAAYVICSTMAGIGGMLFAMDVGSVQPPQFGNFYELYAIAAAVLGGCSLRGGEGTIVGVIIGATVMRVLYNSINMLGIPNTLEFIVIGTVLLLGVIADEIIRRRSARRISA